MSENPGSNQEQQQQQQQQQQQRGVTASRCLLALQAASRDQTSVTATWAQSLDASITFQPGKPMLLSGEASMRMTHDLRAVHQAILVGVATVLSDNPSLTVRLVPGENPRPVILDSSLRCPTTCKVMQRNPLILTTPVQLQADPALFQQRMAALTAAGAEVVITEADEDGRVSLQAVVTSVLPSRGIRSVMIEGGAHVLSTLMRQHFDLVTNCIITLAPVFVGGFRCVQGPPMRAQQDDATFPRFPTPPHVDVLDRDVVLSYLSVQDAAATVAKT